ncbi:MAG: hypothetical protein HRT57_09685 [Crocinitomicaceae bacterium]|nr:hypothetical protein [Crocinitomicaceae bacterium]
MYYSIGIFAALTFAMVNFNQSEIILTSANEPEPVSIVTPLEVNKKFKPRKNMISINPIEGNYSVKLGQQIYYVGSIHVSVGYTVSAYSSNNKALSMSRSFIEYDKKQKPGMCGGDSAKKYFIFDAIKVGTYEVMVSRYYRGSLENEYTITINVE